MKILCVGDVHLSSANLELSSESIEAALRVAKERSPDAIIIMGDWYDRYINSPEILYTGEMYLKQFSEIAATYVLVGNHEMKNYKCLCPKIHALTYLCEKYDNLTIVDSPQVFDICDMNFTMCPYVPPGKLLEVLECVEWETSVAVFGHQEIKGCTQKTTCKGYVRKSSSGDLWKNSYPHIFSGHIHHRHDIGSKVHYVGSITQVSFSDLQNKTVCLIDVEEDGTLEYEHIDLGLVSRIEISIAVQDINALSIPLEDYKKGTKLKLKISGSKDLLSELSSNEVIRELSNHFDLKIHKIIETATENNISIDNNVSYVESLANFLSTRGDDLKTLADLI